MRSIQDLLLRQNALKNQEAWDVMKEYNQVDVLALEDVYLKLKVWDDKHPNVDVYNDNEYSGCTSCGSRNIGEKYSYQCWIV